MAAPSWIQAVKNQANERLFLTGNQLLPEGLDAHAAIGTRVELTYTLVIEDVEGTTTIVLNPLRSNGVEAGWLMNDYEGQRRRLERTTNKFLATLRRLDTAGSNQRSDSVLGAAVGGLQARARIWAIVTDRAALTRNRRWNDLATRSSARVKEAKRLEQAQVLGVLTIDDAAVERRLRHDIMGQPEPLDPATGGSFRTAELTEPFDPEGRPNRAITAFDRSALDAYRTETRLSYLRAWGLRDKTVIDFDTEAMRLYHDVHTPLPVGETAYGHAWRLLGWSVRSPYPRTDPAVAEAGSVRTMPQHATFQSRLGSIFGSATVLAVMPVPNETGEALLYAKSATEQARQGWRTQAVDWKSVRVAVEYEMARLETRQRALAPPAFHWIELRMEPTETALGAPLRLGSSALAIGGGCVPADVASAVARAEAQARSTDWEVEWGTGGAPSGDAALLRELELAPSLASYAALGAFCEALVHALVRAGTRARLVDYLRNPVELAQRAMRRTAQVVGFAYGTDNADRRSALLSRRDPFFAALVDAPAVNSALHHLPPWLAKQREQEALMLASGAAVLPNTTDEMRVFWSALAQRYADAFASALKKLGARLTVHPVRLGSLALHTMWVRDNRLAQQLVTQLLPPKLPAWTTLASQLYEAAAAYGRVLWVLHGVRGGGGGDERMRRGELSLLLEVVAAHPIALQLPSDDLESQRLLQAPHVAASPGAYGEDAPPTHAGRFPVEDRMASVRVDQLSEVRADAAVESTDALAAQLERLQLPPGAGQSGRYHAPPSGSAASLPGDVQHAAAVEDLPVYGSAVEKVCARLSYGVGAALAAPAGALRLYSTEAAVEGRSRHPYLIERRDQAVVLHLARLSPLGAGGALDEVTDAPLPSDIPTLSRLSAQLLAEDERNWVSGDLRDRQRALMWNTERLLRALMLTSASEGGLYVQAPPGWTGEDLRALVGAMALAEAIRVRLFDSLPSLWLEGDQAPVRALCQELLASLAERVGVMPLREVALVLALRLR